MTLSSRRRFLAGLAIPAVLPLLRAADPSGLKLAVTTDEVEADLAAAVPFFREFGVRHAEIRNLGGKYNTSQPESMIREARKILDDAGVQTCVLDTGFFKTALPGDDAAGREKLAAQWDLLERAFVRAEILGTDVIRVFAFTHPKGEKPNPKNYPRIVELLDEAAAKAQQRGVKLALENVGDSYVATAAHSAKILAKVANPALGLTWDPNNSAQMGDPEPFPAGYRMLDPKRIYHVHLRDYQRTADGSATWCGVGQGEFDHVGQIRALLADGYKGALSLETHFTIDGSKRKASEFSMKGLIERIKKV